MSESTTGLDWDGNAASHRSLQWTDSLPSPYPFTAMFKIYPREQPAADNRFSANWFRGSSGSFQMGADSYGSAYYGWTEYPWPDRPDDSSPEISAGQNFGTTADRVTRDNSSDPTNNEASDTPYTAYDQWYSRAITARDAGAVYEHKGYVDLEAGVGTDLTVTSERVSDWSPPYSDSIFMGQTGDNGSGESWGGEPRWEESNAIFRGLQFYDALLTTTEMQDRSACDTNACVLALCAGDPPCPWYLNMNPTPTDVTDKSGNGNDPGWQGAGRPTLWTGALKPANDVFFEVPYALVA